MKAGLNISAVLKQLRKASGYVAKDVTEQLKAYDIEISEKTLYGYESGLSMPNADVFVALCGIYQCDNPLGLFGSSGVDAEELRLIKKYRGLDGYGKQTVSLVLEREMNRTQQLARLEAEAAARQAYPELRQWPCYGKFACAGTGYYFDEIPTETISLPAGADQPQADFVIGVSGDSMEPEYYDGEKVFIRKTAEPELGGVYLFAVGNTLYLKEYSEAGLLSYNPDYAPIPPSSDIVCVGEVVGKVET